MIIDTHAHLTGEELAPLADEILGRAQAKGVQKIVNICTDVQSLEKGLALASRYNWVFNTAATTPHDVEKEGESFFPLVEEAAKQKKLVAIGETGLDYHYEHSPKTTQQKFLLRYLALAVKYSLPAVFHCRDAFEDLFAMTDEVYKGRPALLHCYTGSAQEAARAVDRGWMISFSGILTFKKSEALREVARAVPLSHIVVETDAPYLSPQSMRGSPNEPAFITETVEVLARIKNLNPDEVARATSENAIKFFSF
ncbi:MAG: TatD family hydrolase [Chlamydiales bacterium]|nr:TatD family hydrolase [Chlamydiales bacterium]